MFLQFLARQTWQFGKRLSGKEFLGLALNLLGLFEI